MSRIIVEGKNLATVKKVVKAMGNYRITELVSEEDVKAMEKPTIAGTCSSCPYFTDLIDSPVCWGRCAKYGDSAVNRTKPYCKSYKEEINYKEVRC